MNDMKHRLLYIKAGFLFVLLSLFNCSNFEELNTNPDATEVVPAPLICTNVVIGMLGHSGDAMSYISENTLSKYVGFAVLGKNGAQYNDFGSGSFGGMVLLPNIDAMVEAATGTVMEPSYRGIASFARARLFFRTTLWMGDIPYTQAGKGIDGLFKPKYDLQKDIFLGILDELQAADQYFAQNIKFDGDPTPFNGDPAKWRKAVNAFTLQVLMSLSPKVDDAALDIKNRFAEIVTAGNLMTSADEYLGLVYSATNPHPLYSDNSMFTPKTVASDLLVSNLKKLNDRRLFYFCEPAAAQITAGFEQTDTAAYVGGDVSMEYSDMNVLYKANKLSRLNLQYAAEYACEPLIMLSYAEQQLILAEARIRGWFTTGTGQEYYESGVKAALTNKMNFCLDLYAHSVAIDQNYIDGYFTGEAAFKATTDEQLKQVWMQEYLLRFMQDADFSYFEYRRNSYPEFPINPATSMNENNPNALPLRCLYPESETSYNQENLIEALNRQYDGYDEINKVMWLLK